jgi:hypothetical protein
MWFEVAFLKIDIESVCLQARYCYFKMPEFLKMPLCYVTITNLWHCYRNFNLGLVIKARACEGVGQERTLESHFMLPEVQESVREWTPTLPNKLPLWELESHKFSGGDCKGQNSLDLEDPSIIGKLLEHRCPKWACMTHLVI